MKSLVSFLNMLVSHRNCPLPDPKRPSSWSGGRLRARHILPLIAFAVPTIIIGYGVVLPRSCAAGINSLSIGFGTTVLAACFTYLLGVRAAMRG